MAQQTDLDKIDFVAALEHLTGPSRGTVSWLSGKVLCLRLDPDRLARIVEEPDADEPGETVAVLRRDGGAYRVAPVGDHALWVNGAPAKDAILSHGDTVEFGEDGPMSRYRVLSTRHPIRWSVDDMLGDCIAYVRSSRKPIGDRVTWALGDFGRRLVWETTVMFRAVVVLALVALSVVLYDQTRRSAELEATLDAERARLEGVAASLAEARERTLRPADLAALRQELERRVATNAERLQALEASSETTQRVIARSIRSVAFLQGAYGLRHVESERMLRHVLSAEGIPMQTPRGQPLLSLDGDGPVAEVQFTGTGFVLAEGKLMVTNRHVAVPWESKTDAERLAAAGMEPVMVRLIAYFPGRVEPVAVSLLHASETADLAVLSMAAVPEDLAGLALADATPRAGDEVIVMGYPTGLKTMLAQSGTAFLKDLQAEKDLEFWSVARRLAEAGMIVPLASRGIVGQVAGEAVVYDAETTHGGSGGPALDTEGRVIAVNTAILPEFGGSNLGVPVAKLRAVLDAIGGN